MTTPTQALHPCARRSSARAAAPVALAALLAATFASPPAAAQDFSIHAEPALAVWVDAPQTARFTPGFYGAVRPSISLGHMVSLQASWAMLLVPPKPDYTETGAAHFIEGGIRIRPLAPLMKPETQLGGLFVDFNAGYVRTGQLNRFGFDAGIGYGFQATGGFSLGPVLRYGQILQPDALDGMDPNDAQFVTLGLDLALGPKHHEDEAPIAEPPVCPPAPEAAPTPVCPTVAPPCLDADADGICDTEDRCPTKPGPAGTLGCPVDPCSGAPLLVLVQFPYDSAELPAPRQNSPQTMDPVLDAVADAIRQDQSCRVCIVGYASEEGDAAHNLTLSDERADAVQNYLIARGLKKTRMPTTGFGASCQLVPEASRVMNRRVEFRRLQDGESCPTTCD